MVMYLPLQHWITSLLTVYRRSANAIADKRIKVIQEAISGIRIIKIYAWESSFKAILSSLRSDELYFVLKYLMVRSFVSAITQVVPTFAMIASFICYSLIGNSLDPPVIFASLALFYCLRVPLLILPLSLGQCIDAWVAAERIGRLLLANELTAQPMIMASTTDDFPAIEIKSATFEWETQQEAKTEGMNETFVLADINLSIPRGTLVGIVGPIGSGKSSLLSAMIGEMDRTKGEVIFRGSVAYCQQSAWIQNATLRDNILFGQSFNEERYRKTLDVCCLEHDIELFAGGDSTEIGERGINLSGGQKQRAQIARAVYSDHDIFLFDDQFSAVDSHVGKTIFEECLCKYLKRKTRILVTHQLHFLSKMDLILVMEQGKILARGTFEELMSSSKDFARLMAIYGSEKSEKEEDVDEVALKDIISNEPKKLLAVSPALQKPSGEIGKQFMMKEERNIGAVDSKVYRGYILLAGGIFVYWITLLNLVLAQGSIPF